MVSHGGKAEGFLGSLSWWLAAFTVSTLALGALVLPSAGGRASAQAARSGALKRTADGKPDFTGIWQAMNAADWNIQDHIGEKGVPAGRSIVEGNEIPYRAEALIKRQENLKNREAADPNSKCYLPGVPRIMYMPYPFQIAQGPKQISLLFEYVHAVRNIFMQGPHYQGHIDLWLGDSRGHWDGDVLVVDVVDFIDTTWFDRSGNFHSDELHVVERYTPMGPDHIGYEATIEDPQVFTRPWKMSMILYRHMEPNVELLEYECFAY
jgi:hypothetical protein